MYFDFKDEIATFVKKSVKKIFKIELNNIILTSPPDVSFGEFSSTFPFELAKKLRRSPMDISREFSKKIDEFKDDKIFEYVKDVKHIKGYVNFYLKRDVFFKLLVDKSFSNSISFNGPWNKTLKIIVEHTNINPNKAAHVGHLRNAILGDTLVRLLKVMGFNVETQNYIDNTGVQVADIVVGLKYIKNFSVEDVRKLADGEKFDYYCWDLYTEVGKFYESDEKKLELRRNTLKEIESGSGELYEISEIVSNSILKCHLKTMKRLGIFYDLLPRESDILHLKFWEKAFKLLKEKKVIYFEESGANSGCWVFRYKLKNKDDTKIIVRSNGTVTYTGKDIAYQMWKFGKLGKDFYYKKFLFEDYPEIWITTSDVEEDEEHPPFGSGDMVFNVIDVRQGYTQNIVYEALKRLGFQEEYNNSVHFSYEMVALSPNCAEELGFSLSEEDKKKSFVEVSGRKGIGVKADDLIDKLIEKASFEIEKRDVEGDVLETAKKIAIGALRYYMLKYTKNSLIVFDMDDALSFEGETGPYLQYSVVRAKNILRKYVEKYNQSMDEIIAIVKNCDFSFLSDFDDIWKILFDIFRMEDLLYLSFKKREISIFAKGIFSISQKFSTFYSKYRILNREDEKERVELLSFLFIYIKFMELGLSVLGIPVVERM